MKHLHASVYIPTECRSECEVVIHLRADLKFSCKAVLSVRMNTYQNVELYLLITPKVVLDYIARFNLLPQ